MTHVRLVALFCLPTLWAQVPKPEELPSLRGEVRDSVTGEPVAKVRLMLKPADGPDAWERGYAAQTDATGNFIIPNIRPGQYRLSATRNGFVTREDRDVLVLPSAARPVLRLVPQGVVAGRVLDGDGEPLNQAMVQLLRSRYVDGKKVLAAVHLTHANDLGEYRFPGLAPGRYFVFATDWLGGGPPSSVFTEELAPAYYPNAADSAGAQPLDVATGAQLRADMVLRPQATATVRGRVVVELANAPGLPAVRLNRRASHDDSHFMRRHQVGIVRPSGEFEIRGVLPGSYTATAHIGKGNRAYIGVTALMVGGSNVDGVVITIPNPVTVAGGIRVEGDQPVDLAKARVHWIHGGGENACSASADGNFRLDSLDAGRYEVMVFGLPDGFYTKRVRVAGVDVPHLEVGSGAVGPVEILVSPQAAVIQGVVRKKGKAAGGVTVVLVPKDQTRMHPHMVADAQGRFQFKNLAPGDYRVFAWEEVEATAWLDPEFLKPLEDRGQPVKVAERGEASVEVSVILAESDPAK